MTCKCPHCQGEFAVEVLAVVPDAQRVVFRIDRDNEASMVSAATIAGYVANIDKLMKAVAKEIGARVHVFVERIEWGATGVSFHLAIANVKGGKARMSAKHFDAMLSGLEAKS